MKREVKALLRSCREQIFHFNREIMGQEVEKEYAVGSTQKLHLGVGTHNLALMIPFPTFLDRKLLNRSVRHLVRRQGLLRSVLINREGSLVWRQHAAPAELEVPYLDISAYRAGDQGKILSALVLEKSLKKFPTHSLLYRLVVVKEVLTMYMKKYLKPGGLPYRGVVKIGSFTRYLKESCRGNSLLYRVLLVRRNLKDHLLFVRLDHVIGDDTTLEIIRSSIVRYCRSGGQVQSEEVSPYHEYIEQVNRGPRHITPGELCDFLGVEEYKYYSKLVGNFIDRKNAREVCYFQYRFPFDEAGNLGEERAWEMGFILANLLCKILFGVPRVPAKILYYGRNYGGKTYFHTVGEFWDLIPMLVDIDEDEPLEMVRRANRLVELAIENNINFVGMFLNETLYASWNEVIDLVAPARLTPPESMILIDFLGKKSADGDDGSVDSSQSPGSGGLSKRETRRLKKEQYVSTRSQGGFLIYITYTSKAICLDVQSLIKIEHDSLTRQLDRKAEKVMSGISW